MRFQPLMLLHTLRWPLPLRGHLVLLMRMPLASWKVCLLPAVPSRRSIRCAALA